MTKLKYPLSYPYFIRWKKITLCLACLRITVEFTRSIILCVLVVGVGKGVRGSQCFTCGRVCLCCLSSNPFSPQYDCGKAQSGVKQHRTLIKPDRVTDSVMYPAVLTFNVRLIKKKKKYRRYTQIPPHFYRHIGPYRSTLPLTFWNNVSELTIFRASLYDKKRWFSVLSYLHLFLRYRQKDKNRTKLISLTQPFPKRRPVKVDYSLNCHF